LEAFNWDRLFYENGISWGMEPAESALLVVDTFLNEQYTKVLIPGVGYGRNALPFINAGLDVTGIEISQKAIALARDNNINFPIHQGSVLDMPFHSEMYEGIFCYCLLHLFDVIQRRKVLELCHSQLEDNGIMYFVVVRTEADMFGQGAKIAKNFYRLDNGLKVFFYNECSIEDEFADFGLVDYQPFEEPIKHMPEATPLKCFLVKCVKG